MPGRGGYFIGNLQPAHMDFRFFSLGNFWSIVYNLATAEQSDVVLDLIGAKWNDLVADMPLKICYPALEGQEWKIITRSNPKNTPWSYHNGGSWPTLLWQLTVACIKMNRPELARKAVAVAEKRLSRDGWPEYYDTKRARFIGKQARLYQTNVGCNCFTLQRQNTAKIKESNEQGKVPSSVNGNQNNTFAFNFPNGDFAYLAGCVVVVYKVDANHQVRFLVASRTPNALTRLAYSHNGGKFIAAGEIM